jgi:hypothetical protein
MGEARSPAYVSETFYERLRAAALPDPLRLSINNSLTVLLEDDSDGIVPDDRSFAALLNSSQTILDGSRRALPSIGRERSSQFGRSLASSAGRSHSSPSGILSGRNSKRSQTQGPFDTPAKAALTPLSCPGSCGRASWHIS